MGCTYQECDSGFPNVTIPCFSPSNEIVQCNKINIQNKERSPILEIDNFSDLSRLISVQKYVIKES